MSFTKCREKSHGIPVFTGEMIPQEPLLPLHFPGRLTSELSAGILQSKESKNISNQGTWREAWTAWEESCIKKVTVVLPSEAPFCCPVWLKAAGSEPQPRDKGLFWLREATVVGMGQNRREAFYVVTGPTKCHYRCLQDVIEFCKHILRTCLVPGTLIWWRHNPTPQQTCKLEQESFLLPTDDSFRLSLLWPHNIVVENTTLR